MTNITFKTLVLTGAAVFTFANPVLANDLIDNTAFGYVGGDVLQDTDVRGFENDLNIKVGSITAEEAMNNQVRGDVAGDIRQEVRGDRNTLDLQVGSLNARWAADNRAEGMINGDVTQQLEGFEQTGEIHVGAIDAGENGDAFNNEAMGYVDGSVTQLIGPASTATLSVGSVTH